MNKDALALDILRGPVENAFKCCSDRFRQVFCEECDTRFVSWLDADGGKVSCDRLGSISL